MNITLEQFMELINYEVTDAYSEDEGILGTITNYHYWDGDQEGKAFYAVARGSEVLVAEAHDFKGKRSYRISSEEYKTAHPDHYNNGCYDVAYDEVKFVDLETESDFFDKAYAIRDGEEYDTRVEIPLDFSGEELLFLMKEAHKKDMTFNAYVTMVVEAVCKAELEARGDVRGSR